MSDEFVDHLDYLETNDEKKRMFVKVLETRNNFLKFKTQMGNEVIIPWSRVLKVKIKGVNQRRTDGVETQGQKDY